MRGARQFGLAPLDGIGLNEMVAGRFGLETGEAKLAPWFQPITLHRYEDSLRVTEAGPSDGLHSFEHPRV